MTPTYPAQNQAAGVVVDAEGAHIGEASLTAGASLYTGDVINTESDGHAQLRVRQSRFELIGESYVAFFPGSNGASRNYATALLSWRSTVPLSHLRFLPLMFASRRRRNAPSWRKSL